MKFAFIFLLSFLSACARGQISGCTDPLANNYNSAANINNGSCLYNAASVTPFSAHVLNDTVPETSGLIWLNNFIWTQNDNADLHLYALDTSNGQIVQKLMVQNGANQDWEEITQDQDYVYVGDFGNNGSGNRQNLHILRIAKTTLSNPTATADTIWFHYANQTDFNPASINNTDFDCEAFIATNDSLYLFTKQWVSKKTAVYALPKLPGNYSATFRYAHDVQGLITGATYVKDKKIVVLTGYNTNSATFLNPFVYLLYDFTGGNFFSGNKRKIDIAQPFSQVEGIATADGKTFFISNEKLSNSVVTIPAKLQKIDLATFLEPYYQSIPVKNSFLKEENIKIFPNPSSGEFAIEISQAKAIKVFLKLKDMKGAIIAETEKKLNAGKNTLVMQLPKLGKGIYTLSVYCEEELVETKILVE